MKPALALLFALAALLAVALAVRGPAGGGPGPLAPPAPDGLPAAPPDERALPGAGFRPREPEIPPAPPGSADVPASGAEASAATEPERAPAERPAPLSLRDELARARILERARSHAEALGLAPSDEERIAKVLLEADARGAELRQRARELGSSAEGREELRVDAAELREWRNLALEQEFGRELGARIVALEEAPVRLGDAPRGAPSAAGEAGDPRDG